MIMFISFILDWKYHFFGQTISKKNKNCQFKGKLGTESNSDMQNSMALFTFSVLDWQIWFKKSKLGV